MLHVEESAYYKDFIILDDQMATVGRANTVELARKFAAVDDLVAALKHMLHIFDRELSEDTFGRRACDEAIAALAALKGGTNVN